MKQSLFWGILLLFLNVLFLGCRLQKKEVLPQTTLPDQTIISHAKGFSIEKLASGITIITINSPWLNAETSYTYALVPKEKLAYTTFNTEAYDAIIGVPITRLVATSTTHIPAIEALGAGSKLVGFPRTDFISSKETRARIAADSIKDLGNNEAINIELLLALKPDVVIGFGINNQNKAYQTIKRSNIPVVYNGDWTEETPLGKAEWIKFFAPFFGKEKEADRIFDSIEEAYNAAKLLTKNAKRKPTVMDGGLYKDVWYVAGGNSWKAQFLQDANTNYIWSDTQETGSIGLSIESVLEKGQQAEFWLDPSLHTSYADMLQASEHYEQFQAFKSKQVYSHTNAIGDTGGLLFFELAPNRPDLVLQDLIHIFHPELLPNHQPVFYTELQ